MSISSFERREGSSDDQESTKKPNEHDSETEMLPSNGEEEFNIESDAVFISEGGINPVRHDSETSVLPQSAQKDDEKTPVIKSPETTFLSESDASAPKEKNPAIDTTVVSLEEVRARRAQERPKESSNHLHSIPAERVPGESFEDTLLRNGLEQRDCYSEKEPVEQLIFMLCRVAEEKNFDAEWIKKASEKVSGMISDKQIYDFDLTLAPQEVRKLIPSELRDGSKLSILFKPAAQKLHEGGTDIPVFRGNIPVEKFSERARLTQVIDTHVMEDREGIPTTVLTVKDGVKSTATRYLRNAERLGLLLDPEKQERMVVLGVRDVYEASSENARSSLELIAFKDIAYMNVDNCTHPNNVMKDEDQDRFVQVDTDGTFGTHDSMINPFKGFSEEPFYTDLTQPFTGRELSGVKLSTQTRQAIEKFRENLDVIQDPQKLGLNPELQKTKEAIDRLAIQSAVPYDVYQWMREVADMFLSNGEVLSMHDVIQLMELKKQQDPTYRGYLKSADVNLYLRAVRPSSAIRNPFRSTDRRHAGGA